MKKRLFRIMAIMVFVVSVPIFTFAASCDVSFSAGSRYVSSTTGNCINGYVTCADGQLVVLYKSNGKAYSYERMPRTNGRASFSLPTPTLGNGSNYFFVKSLAANGVSASPTYKLNLAYGYVKLPFNSFAFSRVGATQRIGAKVTGAVKYSSSNNNVVTVNSNGVMTAKAPGSAVITVSAGGVSRKISVGVPGMRSRDAAMTPWYNAMKQQEAATRGSYYDFHEFPTVNNSMTMGTCITFPAVSAQRAGLLDPGDYISISGGDGWNNSLYYKAVTSMNKHPGCWRYFTTDSSFYMLSKHGKLLKGDICCNIHHVFVYMGPTGDGNFYLNHSGRVLGYNSNAAKLMDVTDDMQVNFVASIRCHNIYTTVYNGKITGSNMYMAGQNVAIRYSPNSGRTLKRVIVDGKDVSKTLYKSGFTFKKLSGSHSICVVYE